MWLEVGQRRRQQLHSFAHEDRKSNKSERVCMCVVSVIVNERTMHTTAKKNYAESTSINLSSQCAFLKHQGQQQQQPNNLTIDNYYDINLSLCECWVWYTFASLCSRFVEVVMWLQPWHIMCFKRTSAHKRKTIKDNTFRCRISTQFTIVFRPSRLLAQFLILFSFYQNIFNLGISPHIIINLFSHFFFFQKFRWTMCTVFEFNFM